MAEGLRGAADFTWPRNRTLQGARTELLCNIWLPLLPLKGTSSQRWYVRATCRCEKLGTRQ